MTKKAKPISVKAELVKCPDCGSKEVRYRVAAREHYCRRCGAVFETERTSNGYKLTLKG